MQRDILLITEMIDAAEQAQQLAAGITVSELEADRKRPGRVAVELHRARRSFRAAFRQNQGALPRHPLAAAGPSEEPDSPRLLVYRHRSASHHGHQPTTRIYRRLAQRLGRSRRVGFPWLPIFGELLCWGVFGIHEGDARLIVLGATGVLASLLVLARVSWPRAGRAPVTHLAEAA